MGKNEKLRVAKQGDKYAVEDDKGTVVETADTEQEANKELAAIETEGDLGNAPDPAEEEREKAAGDDSEKLTRETASTPISKTEHNPHGLDIHERFARLLLTLKRHGIHHSEDAHPSQNAQTTPGNFAK